MIPLNIRNHCCSTSRTVLLAALLLVAGCVSNPLTSERSARRTAAAQLKEASTRSLTTEQRAVLYLNSAREAAALLDSRDSASDARLLYNQAATDLTLLLASGDNGQRWNRPQTLTYGGASYRLRFAPGTRDGVWDASYFTAFKPAAEVSLKTIERRNRQDGIGGALVGIHQPRPLDPFSPVVGITAPATATLAFHGHEVTLALLDPAKQPNATVAGKRRMLEADFSAPLAYYPQSSELWQGLMGAVRISRHMGTTGLYMLEPYDPDRIPVIFVHGLISTPRMWRNVINELQMDPELRRRYQAWVFAYPTGNPPGYSALRLREELAKVRQLHPDCPDYVMVGHSMGGLLTRMQVTTVDRQAWDVIGKDKAARFFANIKPGSLVDRSVRYQANPHIARAIFICTPHRGSEMAIGSLGELAMRVISLPSDLATTVTSSLGNSVALITGDPNRLPNSITGLSPRNPTLKVLDGRPMQVPYHTILGDRGKGDSPHSSDGVVEYWSSHLANAKSEHIVPGPHGACELPETLAELKRLLHLHLNSL